MVKLKNLAAAISLSYALSSCITATRPFYSGELYEENHSETISDDSPLARHFFENKDVAELSSENLETLERMIEIDYSDYLGKKVEFPSPYFNRTGHFIILTRRGETNIVFARSLYNLSLDSVQKQKMEFLAERFGADFEDRLNENPELLQEIEEAINSNEAAEEFDRRHNLTPRYAAHVQDLSGYAIPYGFGHFVNLRSDIDSLYHLIFVWEHEYAHNLIYNEMDLEYSLSLLSSYIGLSNNMEIISIHETACNVISKDVTNFFSRHLEGRLLEDYNKSITARNNLDSVIEEIVLDYESIPREERLTRRDEIFPSYERIIEDRTWNFNFRINEARLALMKRYSGDRELRERLETLKERLGSKGLMLLVPKLYSFEDLDFAYGISRTETDALVIGRILNSRRPNLEVQF